MEPNHALNLIEAFEKHPVISGLGEQDKKFFLERLIVTPIPESSRFYTELSNMPEEARLVRKTDDDYSHLSIRRVLRNGKAQGYDISCMKALWNDFLTEQGVFGSNVLTRKLRENDKIVKMMSASRNPHSLLAKYVTHSNTSNTDRPLVSSIRPIVVIPGANDVNEIIQWELANTIYRKEQGLLSIPIRREEYYSLT